MNSAHSRERETSSAMSDGGDSVASSGRVGSVIGGHMTPPRTVSVSLTSTRMEGVTMREHNTVSFDTAARKRPRDILSPLPSPLLSFLSSGASATSASMNQFDLSSSRFNPPSGTNIFGGTRDTMQATAVGNNSLKFVVPSGIKRVRRDTPSSPCSVGEVSSTTTQTTSSGSSRPSPALPPVAPSASSDKIRSVVRGLEHVSRCTPSGCGNPLCVSTRGFMNKVSAHLVAMTNKPGHQADRCGACQLWNSIVRSHASICMEVNCTIPLCSSANEKPGTVDTSTGCRPQDRRDDKDDNRHSLVAQQ